jgi:hypothetical protein
MAANTVSASCDLATVPCYTDNNGNTYRTEKNLGGGYSTTRNGNPYSQTSETLGGGYRETFRSGESRIYNHNPHEQKRP